MRVMLDPRSVHAAQFLARFRTLPAAQVVALLHRHATMELAEVFEESTRSLVAEVAALVPAEIRDEIVEKVGSLILVGYLLHAEEVAAPRQKMSNA
ncbi:hypothetical protein OWM54_42990 [Myxococcus sp. MISCRS1]|uniref:hypothetical protein n=1 Tax=Myxococcus sp. MISCRS1 TaxID=2996786 RepID=UPI0022720578|nr:hypothetical protein [Myxococcus sp. MISCRS1]MCY1003932.1 hypothetical protein [Myxococcus sp. MISCRS1]